MRFRLAFTILPAFLAACATGPIAPPEPVTTRSLTDDYHLVQGMAAGALTSDGVSEANFIEMVKLDHAASAALGSSAVDPGSPDAKTRAQAAIARLAEYAEAVGAGAPPVAK